MAEFGLGTAAYTGIISVGGVTQDWGATYGRTLVRVTLQVRKNSGTGFFNLAGGARGWSTSGLGSSGSGGYDYRGATPQTQTLSLFDTWVNHDVNGNLYIEVGGAISHVDNPPGNGSGAQGYSAPRLGRAPTGLTMVSDTIKPTSARVRAEITSFGNGTGATHTMFYRLQGSPTWINLGGQGDAAGYNDWTITGLQPGRTYEHYFVSVNNNGDSQDSGTLTFKTTPVAGAQAVMMKLVAAQ